MADGYVIVDIAILHHSPKNGFENIRFDPRQLVIVQFDEWFGRIVTYTNKVIWLSENILQEYKSRNDR